jgi:hypothetical protein
MGARVVDREEFAVHVEHRDRHIGLDPHGLAERYVLRSTDEDHDPSCFRYRNIARYQQQQDEARRPVRQDLSGCRNRPDP